MIVLVAAVAVLYYFVFKKDDNPPPTTGPQGSSGGPGEIGFTGVRGVQGFAIVGPQGPSGAESRAAAQVVVTPFSFHTSDNATFLVSPDEKPFSTLVTRIDRTITINAKQIACFINKIGATSFTLRFGVGNRIPTTESIVYFQGYAQITTTNAPIVLTTATRIDDDTIAIIFECNTSLWSGGNLPQCDCFFTLSYQTPS